MHGAAASLIGGRPGLSWPILEDLVHAARVYQVQGCLFNVSQRCRAMSSTCLGPAQELVFCFGV